MNHLPVDDIVLMAVVDALEHLFHEDSSVTLRESSSLEDLVEKLTSLADPAGKYVETRIW